ncbi:MAG: GAF domain-containing protein, partial [Chloroflexi bacterium]|nr:GAF domain-containing protein [Chloroflexota bacterium]
MSIARGEGHQVISHAGTAAGVDLTRLSTVLERFRFEAGSSAAFDISSVRGLTPLFNAIADKVEPLIDFDRLSMALRLGSTKSVETVFVRGIEVNSRPVGWSGDAAVDDPLDITYLDGAIIVEDLKKYEHRSEFTPFLDVGLRSWLEVPLGPVTSPIGWLSVRSSKLAAYGAAQQSLLKQIADMASPVIYQTSVVEAAVFQSRQTRSLSEISSLFPTTAELEAEFPKIAKYISLLIPADRMVLAHFDTVNQVLVDQYIWGVAIPIWDANRSHEYTPTIQQILDTKSGIVDNGSPNFNPEAEKQSLRSGMFAPLISDDHVLGVISVKSTRPYAYGPPDLEIFESIAQQIAGVTNLRNSNRQVTQQSAKFANLATLSRSAEEESELENSLRSLSELISQ